MDKADRNDMASGPIIRKLMYLAVPIIASQALLMLYNLADMFWVGRLGSDELAATGAAGLYMWLSVAFMLLGSTGASIGVSQAFGSGEKEKAKTCTHAALFISVAFGVAFASAMVVFRQQMVGFFGFREAHVARFAEDYLAIVALSMPLTFVSSTLGAVYTAAGNSRAPFICNAVGAVVNMALDPILIFTLGLGVEGAAYATAISQAVACVMLAAFFKAGGSRPFAAIRIVAAPKWDEVAWIIKKSLPVGAESFLFTFLVMATSRREAFFGADAMALSRVGSQIESLTWLVGGAFGTALIAFVGQNFGAKKWDRVDSTFKMASFVMLGYGALVAFVLAVPGKFLFGLFLPEPDLIERSVLYLRILAVCQVPMCLEAVSSNTFRGLGKTLPPAFINTACNVLRVPLVYLLSAEALGMGLPGVWVGISASSCVKGAWSYIWYLASARKARAARLLL